MVRLTVLAATLILGCGGDDDACTTIAGDDAILLIGEADSSIRDVVDGGDVPLIRPVQGGQILLVAARVRSATACTYQAKGTIHDATTDAQLGQDERMLALMPGTDGWARPDVGFLPFINVPVCPSGAATARIDGSLKTLRVALSTDGGDLVTQLEATVVPVCSSADCTADCKGP